MPSVALSSLFFAALGAGFLNVTLALVAARDPADPHQRLRRRAQRRPRRGRRRPRHGPDRSADPAQGRAAAGAAADLRRHQDLDRQRHRHRHDRPAGRRGHARRPDRRPSRSTATRADRRRDHRRRAGDRRRGRPVRRPARRHARRAQARAQQAASRRRLLSVSQEEDQTAHHEQATPHTRARSRARPRTRRRRMRRRRRQLSSSGAAATTPASSPSAAEPAAIKHNDANAKTTLTIGSKNFTEQKVLGEIYAQGLRGRRLHGQEGPQPRRREDGAEGASRAARSPPTRSTPAPRCSSFFEGRGQGPAEGRAGQAYEQVKAGLGQAGHHGLPADAVHRRPTRSR